MRHILDGYCAALAIAGACAGDTVVDNFELLDHNGQSHELYYFSDASYVVLVSHAAACGELEQAMPHVAQLTKKYAEADARFLLINSDLQATRGVVKAAADGAGLAVPVLMDDAQLLGEALGLAPAGEALLVRTDGWQLVWQGPVKGVDRARKRVLNGKRGPRSRPL